MNINILTETRRLLSKDKRSLQAISRGSRIAFSTLRAIKTGRTVSPRFVTVLKLHAYLTHGKAAA